jgi:hypothetical protein
MLATPAASRLPDPNPTLADNRWLVMAGVACGLIPGIRPIGVILAVPVLLYCLLVFRWRSGWFGLGCLSALPALIWNLYWFQSPMGGYAFFQHAFSLQLLPESLPGILFSPSRGLFPCSPILLLALPGFIYFLRQYRAIARDHLMAGLFLATAGMIGYYGCYFVWWGGGSYGPRLLTDVLPTLCLLVGYCLVGLARLRQGRGIRILWIMPLILLVIIAAGYSTLVQYAGVKRSPFSNWSITPIVIDFPQGQHRLWDWHDSEPLRAIRGLQYQRPLKLLTKPQAVQAFRGQILQLSTTPENQPLTQITLRSNQLQYFKVTLQNQSPYDWYGCDYGAGAGETYIAGQLRDRANHVRLSLMLFIRGKHAPQTTLSATGYWPITLPPGDYELLLWPGIGGLGIPNPDPQLAYRLPATVVN